MVLFAEGGKRKDCDIEVWRYLGERRVADEVIKLSAGKLHGFS